MGPCEYVDGKLVRINVPQGYIDSLGMLHAYIHDIQGNVAAVYEAKAGKKQLEQLNEYYAYGGLTADSKGQDRNRYKHTGKELVSDLGINSYDFTARWQYPMAGAFTSPDALAYRKPWNSPYAFCGGDPINRTDPTGLNDFFHKGKKIGSDGIDNGAIWVVPDDVKKDSPLIKSIKKKSKKDGSESWEDIFSQCVNTGADYKSIKEMRKSIEDDGKGGTSDKNNREYGGTYEKEEDGVKVKPSEKGPVNDPSIASETGISIPGNGHKYHSHPSGTKSQNGYDYGYVQKPSDTDIDNAKRDGNPIRLVFGMAEKKVYIYNGNKTISSIKYKSLKIK